MARFLSGHRGQDLKSLYFGDPLPRALSSLATSATCPLLPPGSLPGLSPTDPFSWRKNRCLLRTDREPVGNTRVKQRASKEKHLEK